MTDLWEQKSASQPCKRGFSEGQRRNPLRDAGNAIELIEARNRKTFTRERKKKCRHTAWSYSGTPEILWLHHPGERLKLAWLASLSARHTDRKISRLLSTLGGCRKTLFYFEILKKRGDGR